MDWKIADMLSKSFVSRLYETLKLRSSLLSITEQRQVKQPMLLYMSSGFNEYLVWLADDRVDFTIALSMVSSFRIQAVRATSPASLPPAAADRRPEYRVASTGDQRTHIEHRSQPAAATPDTSLAPTRTAVSVEGRHADQSGDPIAVERTKFRQLCQKRQGELLSHTGHRAQQVVPLTPYETAT